MKNLRFWMMAAVVSLSAVAASGQVGIYGMGSGGFLSSVTQKSGPLTLSSDSFSAYGGTFGVYDNFRHFGPIRFGADARAFVQSSSNNNAYGNQLRGGLVGLRLAVVPHVLPILPYVQAEVGVASTNYGVSNSRTASLAYQVQGGLDYTVFPHLDVRVEYGIGQIGAQYADKQVMQQVGIGLAVRL